MRLRNDVFLRGAPRDGPKLPGCHPPPSTRTCTQWIGSTCDYVALLLCIHMCQQFLAVMARRRIP